MSLTGQVKRTIHEYCKNDDLEAVKNSTEDLNSLDRCKNTPLIVASMHGRTEIVKYLLSKGVDVNRNNVNYHSSALTYACWMGHTEIVVELLRVQGIRVDQREKNGNTPLINALLQGHLKIAEILLKNGAKPHLTNRDGQSGFTLNPMLISCF
jgi:ankyrin repeat protein